MSLISISGKIGSGKDTTGKIINIILNNPQLTNEGVLTFFNKDIVSKDNWQIKKWADKLKDIVCILLNCTREQLEDQEFKNTVLGEEWWIVKSGGTPAKAYLDVKGKTYNALSDNLIKLTPRLMLQLFGTECGREIIHPNIWVNATMGDYKAQNHNEEMQGMSPSYSIFPNWIITDMRFPNELEAVQKRSGITIRVNRTEEINTDDFKVEHESETLLDDYKDWDYIIQNDGTIEDLIVKIREILTNIKFNR